MTPKQNRERVVARGLPTPRALTPTSGGGRGDFLMGKDCKNHPNQLGQPWVELHVSLSEDPCLPQKTKEEAKTSDTEGDRAMGGGGYSLLT